MTPDDLARLHLQMNRRSLVFIRASKSGAASVVALQDVYTVAPKDGTVIGAVYPQAIMEPLLAIR